MADRLENVHRPSTPNLFLTVKGDMDLFRKTLTRNGVDSKLDEDKLLQIITSDGALPMEVWDSATQSDVQVQSVVPAKNSLETVFREAVGEDVGGD
ncbi:MAG: hypothetical protein P8M80_08170 [Pirellulaceae bacterium]|nr:hypothetical protein [Pirellulaceae bacterium]